MPQQNKPEPAGPLAAHCVAIDFETSGYAAHSACAVGLARVEQGRVTDVFYSPIRPPSSRILFTEIHGLTWAMLKDAPTFAEVYPRIEAFVRPANALLAHNASFDRRVLNACCQWAHMPPPRLPFFCTLKGARGCLPLPSKKLNDLCAFFGIALNHHHAGSDAAACAEVYLRLRAMGMTNARMRV